MNRWRKHLRLLVAAGLLGAAALLIAGRRPPEPASIAQGAAPSAERARARRVRPFLGPALAASPAEDSSEPDTDPQPTQTLLAVLASYKDAVCGCADWACVQERANDFELDVSQAADDDGTPAAEAEADRLRTALVACQERLYRPIKEQARAERIAERERERRAFVP
jgi:hypothetical protein